MDSQQIVTQLIEILTPLTKGRITVTENTELASDMGLDSMQVMQLVVAVEDHFDISVPINAIAEVKTVRDFALRIQECIDPNS